VEPVWCIGFRRHCKNIKRKGEQEMEKVIERITIQDFIDLQLEDGITDLEINIVDKGHIEIGHYEKFCISIYEIKDNKLVFCYFPRYKETTTYMGDKAKAKKWLNFVYTLIDEGTYIDTERVEETKGVIKIHREKENIK
jgi:hypothetical protein